MRASKVLVVESSQALADELVRSAAGESIEFETVVGGEAGIDRCRRRGLDAVVLAMDLPGVSGLEVLRRFRSSRQLRGVPVIGLVREGLAASVREEALELGAVDCVSIPCGGGELVSRIDLAIRNWARRGKQEVVQREERRRVEDERLRMGKALEIASDAVMIQDETGLVVYVNAGFERLAGWTAAEVSEGGRLAELFGGAEEFERLRELACVRGTWAGELVMTSRGGVRIVMQARVALVSEEGGSVAGWVWAFSDVTLRKRLEEEVRYLGERDALTGLWNRSHFLEQVGQAVVEARSGKPSYLLYVDLDHFKVVNNAAGTAAGDRLLSEIAKVLREGVRSADSLSRLGSDEFTVLLRGLEEGQAMQIARRLLSRMEGLRFGDGGRVYSASASIGVVKVDGAVGADEALSQAHSACHLVKARGRNDCLLYRPDDEEMRKLVQASSWSLRIRDAMQGRRVEIWFQPVLPLAEEESGAYYEVLLRMRTPDGSLVLPGDFFPAAERFGNAHQLDEYAMREAVSLMAEHGELRLALNLSARSLIDPSLVSRLRRLLEETGVKAERLGFEVTETAMIQNLTEARVVLRGLKAMGCQIALDDFGAGVSSMMYLRELPIDVVKIEGSFVRTIDVDPINRALVKSMNELAHLLGKKTVAEHVVNAGVLRVLRELRVDYVQGWFLAEPARPADFLKGAMPRLSAG